MSEYTEALEDFDDNIQPLIYTSLVKRKNTIKAIRHALLIADRVMGEPSVKMLAAGKPFFDEQRDLSGWEDMRDQLIREVTDNG